jgi:hypothetical protein
LVEQFWDVQNDHASHIFSANPDGKTDGLKFNEGAPRQYDDIHKYSTPWRDRCAKPAAQPSFNLLQIYQTPAQTMVF